MTSRSVRDREVSALGLGGANWSFRLDRNDNESIHLIRAAIEAGITLIDTARAYTTDNAPAHNEELIARALRELGPGRDEVLVSTKGGHFRRGDDFPIDGSPESLRRDCDASLSALGMESLDLYFLHHPDPFVPIEESVGALEMLRSEGKIRYVGVSNVSADQYARASSEARIDAVENEFSLFVPGDRELIRDLADQGVAYLAYSPLGGGRRATERVPETFMRVADQHAVSPEQVMLSWELGLSTNLVPIIGPGRIATLVDCIASTRLTLSDEEIADLSRAVGCGGLPSER